MKRYDMTQFAIPERYFLTREKGEEAYELLHAALREIDDEDALVLVFPPNQLMDASFADEAVIRLMEGTLNGQFGTRAVLLQGLTEDSVKNLNAVIHLRNLKMAALLVDASGRWQVIGQLEKSLRETLDMVAEHDTLTAPQLAERIGSAVNTASNRLKRLYDGRLIRREHEVSEKGLQYIYSFWNWLT